MTLLLAEPTTTEPGTVSWMPARFSAPLVDDFTSDGDWLLRLVDLVWKLPDGSQIVLDEWQRWLIRSILETYPPGHKRAGELRYRQVLVSVSRQNGKSVLGAILALYGLVREAGALVIGIASSAEQARIIYARLLGVIKGNRTLARKFARMTDTRGIQSHDGCRYEIKPSKSAAVQGLDLSVGLVDELHLTKPDLWSDMVNGSAARANGIVVGLTTAGDDTSELLIELYDTANDAPERFGYFIWEAPDDHIPDDDETLGRYLMAASPGLACGRLDLDTAISDVRGLPPQDVIRYRFNRFTAAKSVFIDPVLWASCKRPRGDEFPTGRPVFAVDLAPAWSSATITANVRAADTIHTEIVASIINPTLEQLVNVCVDLNRHAPLDFAMDGYALRPLAAELKLRGLPVTTGTQADAVNASQMLYAKIKNGTLRHAGDALLKVQIPRTIRKNVGDSFRISRADSSIQIDSVMATAYGVYYAETTQDRGLQIF